VTLAAHTRTVRAAYDAIAPTFGRWNASIEGDPWAGFVAELENRVDDGARVLDLGCGDGTKTRRLTEHFEVVAWAAEHGYRELVTYTQEGNKQMRAINEKLGYRERPAWILVRRGV
jgi:2-polyprenyl-3-methyl-5-hydroxy-6-metoxy-1,4-benzoquinol methylase